MVHASNLVTISLRIVSPLSYHPRLESTIVGFGANCCNLQAAAPPLQSVTKGVKERPQSRLGNGRSKCDLMGRLRGIDARRLALGIDGFKAHYEDCGRLHSGQHDHLDVAASARSWSEDQCPARSTGFRCDPGAPSNLAGWGSSEPVGRSIPIVEWCCGSIEPVL